MKVPNFSFFYTKKKKKKKKKKKRENSISIRTCIILIDILNKINSMFKMLLINFSKMILFGDIQKNERTNNLEWNEYQLKFLFHIG